MVKVTYPIYDLNHLNGIVSEYAGVIFTRAWFGSHCEQGSCLESPF